MPALSEMLNTVTLGDSLEVLKTLPDQCVDLILTDPPYFKIVANEWDRQWKNLDEFRVWVATVAAEFRRVLKPHGALYWFCDEKVGAYCQVELDRYFSLLNNLVWRKPCTQAALSKNSGLRSYAPCTERILFYEQKNASGMPATGLEAIHSDPSCFASLKKYMREEREKVKQQFGFKTQKEFDEWANNATGTASVASRHYWADSQYGFPTEAHYLALREASGRVAFRREYEDLRREYEDLRRPWNNHIDADEVLVYRLAPPPTIHPTQKPVPLLCYLLERSTRPGFVVLDPFSGSGSVAVACHRLGLDFVAIERDPGYHAASLARLKAERAQLLLNI